MDNIINEIKGILVDKSDANLKLEQIDDNASLLEDGLGLDSIAIVNFLVNLETHFNIEFSDSEMDLELFRGIDKLSEKIHQKLQDKS